ncbi:hypothetical protein TNCT_225911 [Trichonephila clavata]|uniref:Uncharacterized protein n=1 Tax=Trichonephila clavata TaxID=2740835 RepID=A0A8X6L618_TRICU|nr:hypothetical protein TNCT_225911 [Trichonephila clavata]
MDGSEKADFLARTVDEEAVSPTGFLSFSELSSLKKIELNQLIRAPPLTYHWYFGRNPGGSFRRMPWKYHTTFLRFVRGHIKANFSSELEEIT